MSKAQPLPPNETIFLHGNDTDEPSRTEKRQKARDAEAKVRGLVTQLIQLTPKQLAKLHLSDGVLDGISIAQTLPASKAKQRQIKLLARLLAEHDPALIQRQLAALLTGQRLPEASPPQATDEAQTGAAEATTRGSSYQEEWLRELLEAGDAALQRLIEIHPELNRQELRQLLRSAKKASSPAGQLKARQALSRALPKASPAEEGD